MKTNSRKSLHSVEDDLDIELPIHFAVSTGFVHQAIFGQV